MLNSVKPSNRSSLKQPMVNVEELYLMWLMEVFNIDIENPKKECKTHGPAECSLEEDQEKNNQDK